MKHKIIPAVLIALIAVCLLCGTAAAAITGSGTSSDPYIIHDKNDLRLLSGDGYAAYTAAGYFALDADITFTDSDAAFTPIGNKAHKFVGSFDGRNHKITKLKTTGNPTGLFAYVSSGASISNIEFHDAQITGTGVIGTGVLYGQCYQADTKVIVSNVKVYDSKITTNPGVVGGVAGGVAGGGESSSSQVEFTSCLVNGCVITCTGNSGSAGGVAGYAGDTYTQVKFTSCVVKDCVITSQEWSAAGVAGYGGVTYSQVTAQSCDVENCYIYAKKYNAGGIFGFATHSSGSTCTITNCNVLKSTIIADGNFAGGIYSSYRNNGGRPTVSGCTVTDCTVQAGSNAGGVAGGYGNG